jgi:DNA polymerase-3 subunit alpha
MYEMLSRGEAIGVFQLESGGMRELLRKFKPEVFEDLIAILALYRPGPLGSGMVDDFVLRKQGVNPVTYMVPQLESILKETYGVIVYQEQVMQISSRLGGFTLAQADELRRAMGKKDKKTLDAKREEFLAGSRANAIDDDTANQIYDLMCKFAEYGFNKSHSAAYALVTYRTAYLKANYLVEFVAALLTSEKGNTDKLVEYIAEAKDLGLTVLAPDVNQSGANFTVTGEKEIRFGLSAIKNVGEGPVADIIAARANGAFKDLFDFCSRVDVKTTNKKVMESLIKAGALDAFGKRAAMMECYGRVCDAAARVQEERTSDQFSLFGAFGGDSRELFASDVKVPDKPEWDKETFLQNEKEMLGFYLSGHPLENYANLLRCTNLVSTANIVNHQLDSKGDDEETYVTIACVLEKVKISTTKKEKKMMAVVRLEDGTSHIEAVAFPKTYDRVKEALVEGNKVLVSGSVKQEEEQARVFLNDVVPLSQLYDKLTVLSIYLDENDRAAVAQIKDIFAKYPGKTEVHIHFRSPELRFVRIKPKNDYFVMPREELLGELMALLGKEKVKVAMAENPERKRFKKRWDGNRGGGSGDE